MAAFIKFLATADNGQSVVPVANDQPEYVAVLWREFVLTVTKSRYFHLSKFDSKFMF
jgi:hypothetical protein